MKNKIYEILRKHVAKMATGKLGKLEILDDEIVCYVDGKKLEYLPNSRKKLPTLLDKEYGINNVIVETYLVVTIKEQVIMPLSSKRKNIVIKEPLTIDIIQGSIPNYYNGYLK